MRVFNSEYMIDMPPFLPHTFSRIFSNRHLRWFSVIPRRYFMYIFKLLQQRGYISKKEKEYVIIQKKTAEVR